MCLALPCTRRLPERALQVTDFAAAARAREDARLQRINALLYGTAAPAVSVASNALGGSNADDTECCICLDAPEEPVASPCGHVFCKQCIRDALSQERRCGSWQLLHSRSAIGKAANSLMVAL